MTMEQQVANINQQIDHLLNGLGNEGLLDDQFAQLMQLQARAIQEFPEAPVTKRDTYLYHVHSQAYALTLQCFTG